VSDRPSTLMPRDRLPTVDVARLICTCPFG